MSMSCCDRPLNTIETTHILSLCSNLRESVRNSPENIIRSVILSLYYFFCELATVYNKNVIKKLSLKKDGKYVSRNCVSMEGDTLVWHLLFKNLDGMHVYLPHGL